MFDYLINYGVQKHSFDYSDIDVNDRMALQDQINDVRRNYSQLLILLDDIQGKIINCNNEISQIIKQVSVENGGSRLNSILNQNEEYVKLDAELQALKTGASMVNAQIDFYKNDLRILNSVFYNKF